MTPAGTSNELDVQNEWEENTHTHISTEVDSDARVQKQAQPRFARPTLIVDISTAETYSRLPIRHTARTLDNTLHIILTSGDIGVIRHNTVVVKMDP